MHRPSMRLGVFVLQMPALAADWRVRLQADQLQDVLEAQRAFEQRKAVLMEELARKV